MTGISCHNSPMLCSFNLLAAQFQLAPCKNSPWMFIPFSGIFRSGSLYDLVSILVLKVRVSIASKVFLAKVCKTAVLKPKY